VSLSLSQTTHFESTLIRNPSGGHETPGQFTYGDFNSDIVDIDVVVKHLESKYGYVVTMMVSHSKASMVTMRYLCTYGEAAANVKCFVNVSGRYRMVRPIPVIILENLRSLLKL